MSHIPDGQLHAYLDGALDQLGDAESKRVRAHLEDCAACRNRLEEERLVRQEALDILSAAQPKLGSAPSFEELRRRAREAPTAVGGGPLPQDPSRGPGRAWSLAWAATILLSLGLGWAGRGVVGSRFGSEPAAVAFEESAPRADMAREAFADAATAERQAADGEARSATPASEPIEEAEAAPASGAAALGNAIDEIRVQGEAGPTVARRREVAAMEEATLDVLDSMAARDAVLLQSTTNRRTALRSPPLDDTAVETAAAAGAAAGGEAAPAPSPEASKTDGAESREPLAVPGLEILSIQPDPGVPGQPGVRILQRLHQGDTLELRYFGILSDADARLGTGVRPIRMGDLPNPPLEPGWNQVVLRRGSGWLVARAPMTRESLEFLLRLLN